MSIQYTLSNLPEVAALLVETYGPTAAYALAGELGTGKTTLVAELCRQLGVTEPVSSPTFAIVNEYRAAAGTVYHLDCYRLESTEEALAAGLEETIAGATAGLFVEWPAVVEPLLPEGVVFLRLSHLPPGKDGHPRRKLYHEQ